MDRNANVIDVTDATFAADVLEESKSRPVVVDFWAAWCQPCRMIGPVLERLAEEAQGEFLLAKLDVDANREAAAAFRIQSIPAVKAFRDGLVVDEFVGAVPEQAIREFLGSLVPSEADRLAREAEDAERLGSDEQAEALLRRALVIDPAHRESRLGLARLSLARGEVAEVRGLLDPLRPDPEAERLLAAVQVAEWGDRIETGDGAVAQAQRAAAEGRYVEALDGFLSEVMAGSEHRGAAKEGMLKLFAVLGDDDPLTQEYRRRLSAALF